MKYNSLYISKAIFFIMVGIFILILAYFVAPVSHEVKRAMFPFATALAIIFFALGIILIFLTRKLKIEKKLKVFLILTGASAAGFLVSVLLHNFFYALGIITKDITILKYLMEILHVAFFLIAIPVCPILFLISIVSTIVLFIKKRR